MYWVIHENEIFESEGYDRSMQHKGVAWFPELGYTMHKGIHYFDTKKEAKNHLIKELKKERAKIDKKIKELVGLEGFF